MAAMLPWNINETTQKVKKSKKKYNLVSLGFLSSLLQIWSQYQNVKCKMAENCTTK